MTSALAPSDEDLLSLPISVVIELSSEARARWVRLTSRPTKMATMSALDFRRAVRQEKVS